MSTRCNIEFFDGDVMIKSDQPAARLYQHGDGYPEGESGVLARLKKLETIIAKDNGNFGGRTRDPEFAAAEYISQFRKKMGGDVYVSQTIHGDIEYLYRVACMEQWQVFVFVPVINTEHDIVGFEPDLTKMAA